VTARAALILALLACPQDDKPTPKVELKGCVKVEGISFKQGQSTKYTGDTYLVKILFTNEKGDAVQPTPVLNFVVYNGQEPYKKVQRIVTREQWKADAAKINRDSVADNTIACDKKSGELWVALVRTETPVFEPKADITLVIPDIGIWTWKGLSGKFEAAPRAPDLK
jgi:hypothetical protein